MAVDKGRMKRVKGPGVETGDASPAAAAKVIEFHALRLETFGASILDGSDDPELVHDMRVATRRMRATLDVFARFLPGKRTRKFGDLLRMATRRLGRPRDLDLMVLDLNDWIQADPARKAAQAALDDLQARRDRARARMRRYLSGSDYESLRTGIPLFLETARSTALSQDGDGPGRGHRAVSVAAPILILEAEATALEAVPGDGNDLDALHNFRISLKRLRYTLEVFREILKAPGEECLAELRRHQDILGRIQDARVHGDEAAKWLDSGSLGDDASTIVMDYADQKRELARGLAQEFAQGQRMPWSRTQRRRLFAALAGLKGNNP